MHPAISTSYILPAIFLNPVVFLHGLNTLISRLLPPIVVSTASVQRPAYSLLGPAATYPHIDIQNSENLCWSYTMVMIFAQLVAYGRVMKFREAGKEKQRRKEERKGANGDVKHSGSYWEEENSDYSDANSERGHTNGFHNLQCPTLKQPQKDPNSPQKNRAPQPAQLEPTEGPASDLIDVDSPHISQVHSDFKSQSQQTSTQASRMAHEAEDQARQTASSAERKASETGKQAEQKGSELSGEAKKKASEFSDEASQKTDELSRDGAKNYDKAKKVAGEKYREGKEFAVETKDELNVKARETKDDISANRDNPVVVGNAIAWTIGGVVLGVGAYNKHVKGELDWGVVGLAAGAVGVLAVGDYYLSQWLFKNKYPKK